ncbi:MAG: hypothetical protein WB801_11225 [Candidatus Dormiibacterota bacterium]
MDSFRFSDHVGSEPEIALGLTAPRLGLAGTGAALAWALLEAPGPALIRLGATAPVVLTTAMLAWGRVQGVSLARWFWLAIQYLGRSVQDRRERGEPVDLGSDLSAYSKTGTLERGALGVAFVSLRRGAGCTSVCRAVGIELAAAEERAVRSPSGRSSPNLILYDWGSQLADELGGGPLMAVVLVWDGIEAYPGQLAGELSALRCAHPLAFLLVTLNRAGPAGQLSWRIAEAGARLICTIPVDRTLGRPDPRPTEALAPPSAEGVRTLANALLAASSSW